MAKNWCLLAMIALPLADSGFPLVEALGRPGAAAEKLPPRKERDQAAPLTMPNANQRRVARAHRHDVVPLFAFPAEELLAPLVFASEPVGGEPMLMLIWLPFPFTRSSLSRAASASIADAGGSEGGIGLKA